MLRPANSSIGTRYALLSSGQYASIWWREYVVRT